MPITTAQKLKIKEGSSILAINAPADYQLSLGPLPAGVRTIEAGKTFDQVHWFVKDRSSLEKRLEKIFSLVRGAVICWIFYPKGTSGMQTDLNRDNLYQTLLQYNLQFLTLVSFNDTWSAFGLREQTEKDRAKAAEPKERPVFDYVDPERKTVTLPADLAAALKMHKTEAEYFNTLSFSNKKEYIEWIVTAKREATRKERVAGTIERLSQGWKNPAGR